ncbi:non-ribosomal peptide synthase/polyketide synthase [Marilutibacter maris]|uniref:Putative non-ribosomal peptide synthetase protein n=1 Tax=Marilutibacter maris TaxID=1605891 RepID=A0A2U9TAX7_9GAMM|nr:non-ribosomal peptide synthase/polyketide synthase [Lysobacter maris]AWV08515.1 putative non-ribosomal peptide synthetase protein [Lysobacter maris]
MTESAEQRQRLVQAILLNRARRAMQARESDGDAIAVMPRDAVLPLSLAQRRLWFLCQLDGTASAAYHMPDALRLEGELDVAVLRAALDALVVRHESLRTRFVARDGEPEQVIDPADTGFALREIDLSALPAATREAAVAAQADEEAAAAFDLAAGPLVRGRLLRLDTHTHVLLLTQHHIVSDGWSVGVLIRELGALYRAFAEGAADPLPPLPLQYADYAAWQHSQLAGEAWQRQIDYWKETLSGAPSLLELPGDRPRPPVQSYRGASLPLRLDPELVEALRGWSSRHGATLFMALTAGWSALLSRLGGQDEVVIGTPVANRPRAELEGLAGFFVNTLALRVAVDASVDAATLLARVKAQALGAFAHQQLPFDQVVEHVRPQRSLGHSPVFQTMLALNNTPGDRELSLPGLRLQPQPQARTTTQFDLSLVLNERDGAIVGAIEYATDLFDVSTIQRWAGYLQRLLQALPGADAQPVAALPMLPDSEREQLEHGFNATARPYPADSTIAREFAACAARRGDAIALCDADTALSYAELDARANRIAHGLRAHGVDREHRVALIATRSLDLVVATLGVLKAGAAYVPLDPEQPAGRLAELVADSGARVVLSDRELDGAVFDAVLPLAPPAWGAYPDTDPAVDGDAGDLAYVMYTSGSTGTPKGVMVEQRSVLRLAVNGGFAPLGEHDVVAHCANPAFDASTWELWAPLLNGARVAVIDPPTVLDPAALSAALEKAGVTAMWLTVGLFNAYVDALEAAFGRLDQLLIGGDALDVRTVGRLLSRPRRPRRLINGYGPTETTTFAATHEIDLADVAGRSIPIGRPIGNTTIRIVDGQGRAVPVGVVGELYIGGAGVARGYLNQAGLSAEKFVADPLGGPGRYYRTGDLGRWRADGTIEFAGRNDGQVKLRGFRIELGEIEAALQRLPGVREAVVTVCEGEGGRRLVGYLVGAEGGVSEWRQALSSQLPEYMLPSALVSLEALPLTANGKLDRRALPEPDASSLAVRGYEAPRDETERALASIWGAILRVERVGIHDNFFELGGHSLLAARLAARVAAELQRQVPVSAVFSHPSVARMAEYLQRAETAEAAPIAIADRSRPLPPSLAQRRLWFLVRLDEAAGNAYHMADALRLEGELDVAMLRAALDALVARHESLRTRFVARDGEPEQVIDPADTGFALREIDLSALPAATREAAVAAQADEEAAAAFDLAAGPLVRGRLLRLDTHTHVLLLTQHHIVSDGWSVGVLIRELGVLYRAFAEGASDPLPPLPLQYADYAAWQHGQLAGEAWQRQIDYWKETLSGAPSLLELPGDRPRPPVQSYRGASLPLRLDPELVEALRGWSSRHGATLFMALTAGWSALLSRLGGQDEVVIGTPVANRPRAELEGLAGFFVNTLALRVAVDASVDAATLLARVKAQALGAFAHQQLPFDQVVEHVRPQRSLGHSPVFQTMLALNNTPGDRELALPGLRLRPQPQARTTTQFDLSLALNEHDGALVGELEYATDLFDASTVQRWAGYLPRLLQAMVAMEDRAVARLPWLPEQELAQLRAWSMPEDTAAWPAATLPALFEAQVRRTPEAEALRFEGRSLSYDALNRAANRVAHRLLALGVKPDDRVAIRAERGLELLVGLLGILKSGAGYVPIDPGYPRARQDYMLADSAPAALLVDTVAADEQTACPVLAIASDTDADEHDPQIAGLTPRHLAYVIYTSGSTGQPKGVMVEHASVAAFVRTHAEACRLQSGDRVLHFASCSFDTSIEEIFPALLSGATVVVRPSWMVSPDRHFVGLLADERIAILDLPTAFFHVWAQQAASRRPALPEQVRLVVVGGEKLEREALDAWFAHPSASRAAVLNTYGPTEATVYVTSVALEADSRIEGEAPIGRPSAGTRVWILDPVGAPVPQGVVGEIHVGGVQVARGYLGQPALTAERFVPDPDGGDDARLYRTGDLGRWLGDGSIAYAGRRDAQIKLRGFRIEPGEIEHALRRCDGVADALVLLREDAPDERRLVAYVVAAAASEPSEQALHAALSVELAAYMLPSAYVVLEAFPLTPSGKVDRAALPAPGAAHLTVRDHEPPVGAVEAAIARVWAGLFAVERVGRRDNFFELGGHSLLAIAMIERLADEGIELPVRALFVSPVLADLAAQVSRGTAQAVPPNPIGPGTATITPELLPLVALSQASIDRIVQAVPGGAGNVQDIYPLAPLQEGILFHYLLHGVDAADPYVLRVGLEFDSTARMERFIGALKRVVARHDVLRTALFWRELERPVQVVLREVPLPVFEGVPGPVRMDLGAAPLLQLWRSADTDGDGATLTVLWHHIVSDAVAMGVILDEVRELLLAGAAALPPAAPYRDFIARTGAVHDSVHEAYFRERLGSVDETTAIGGVLDVRQDGAAIRQSALRLEEGVAAMIRRAAAAAGTAPSVLFHAAWAHVLSAHAGRADVVFGTVLTGRLQGLAQAGRTVGMFINTLPLRLDLAGRGVAEAVGETRLRLGELLAHEHASLALAQRCSAVAAGVPLFTVLLNYRQHGGEIDGGDALSLGEGVRVSGGEARNNYPLTVSVDDYGVGFGLTSLSVGDIDGPALARHLARVVEALAAAMLSDPQQRIDALALIDDAERERLLALGRGPAIPRERAGTIADAFQARAAHHPQAIALRETATGKSTDYATLAAHVNRLAHALREQGLGPGDRVGLCMERGLALPIALLAVLASGAAYVPLDGHQGGERLARIIADAGIGVVLVESGSAPASLGGVDTIYLDGAGTDPDWLGEYPSQPPTTALADDAIAYVLYTSGSTGEPKGVEVFHSGLSDYCAFAREGYYDEALDGSLVATSHAFDLTVPSLYVPLLEGGCVELLPPGEELPALARRLDEEAGAWLLRLTPSHVQGLLQLADAVPRQGAHAFVIGGEAFPASLARALQTKYPQARLVNHYGPTETVVGCAWQRLDEAQLSGEGTLPIGRAMSNTRLYVLGASGQLLPRGVAGELYIGGAGVARGYLNDASRTAERFLADPFEAGGRMYRSGDRVRWRSDGALEFLGRVDAQVKLRGYRIEPGEIESVLRPQVGDVAVGVYGEGGTARLVAWVSGVSGDGWEDGLRALAASRLPAYMQPSVYVSLEALPLTANGKLDRRRLPEPERPQGDAAREQPQGVFEQGIASIWSELLGVEAIARDDDFFALGGHSLTAVQAVARLRAAFRREVPLRELFSHPSPRSLARYLDQAEATEAAPIAIADRSRPLPPSLAQRRLWFLSQLDGAAGAAYHMPVSLRLEGELDVAVLRAALDALVVRHESLRTRFVARDGEPEQVIDPADTGFALREIDLSALPVATREAAVAAQADEEAAAAFDLAAGPLVRGRLLRLDTHTHVLLLTQHHIVSDGWSVGVLIRELGALYRAFAEGAADPLPPLPLQYADYAAWQHGQLAGEAWQRQIDYWKETLSGAPSLLELPGDRRRPPVQSYRGASLPLRLDPELVEALRGWSSRHGATLFMALTAGWSALLSRLGGQDEVVIGTPVANRPRAELEGLAGFFVNTLALRVAVDASVDAATLLARVKAQALGAFAHQQLPFDQVVEHVRPQRSLGHSPVFQTMLALNNTPGDRELALPGLRLRPQPQARTTTQFDLSLALNEHDGTLVGELEYATDLFDASTVQRWAGYLPRLLQAMVAMEDRAVARLPWLPEQELAQLRAWSMPEDTAAWPAATLPALFEAQVRRTPEAEALRFEGRSLSYDALNRAANRVAHRLLALGVKPDDRVAIRAERGLELLVGLLGILKSGAGYVPIDPGYPRARQDYMLADSAPAALLVDTVAADEQTACPVLAIASDTDADEHDPQIAGLTPRHLAYVIYTSGSTGQPKGVMVEHASVINLWRALEARIAPACPAAARVTLNAGVSFDASLQGIVQWLSGRCVVVVPAAVRSDADALRGFLREERIDVCDTTPAQLETLLASGLPDVHVGGPRVWLIGGEAIAPRLWQALAALDSLALNVYGPTECTVDSTCARIGTAVAPHIGRPLANVRIRLLDAFGAPVPIGVRGQIHIGGAALARGYWRRPELTAERFVELEGGRFYRSGDIGRWREDGRLEYLGRDDDQVKLRGHRIELGEVEAALVAVPGIEAAAVLLGRDAGGAGRLVAYVASADDDTAGWHDRLAARLPAHMLPAAYVRLDRLPLTANGKIDRRRLPDCGREAQVSRGHVEPRTATERTLTDIWQNLLGVERVGIEDNFFELGGHSLLAMRMTSAVAARLGRTLPVRVLFEGATPAAVAAWLDAQDAGSATAEPIDTATIERVPRDGRLPMSYSQQRLWFIDRLQGSDAYRMSGALRLRGRLDVERLHAALREVVARHEVLRTTYGEADGEPVQRIGEGDGLPFAIDDLRGLDPATRDGHCLAIAAEEAAQPFDLGRDRMLRGRLAVIDDDEHVLWLTAHHIAFDGWSYAVLVRECMAVYAGERLPPLPVQYADYAAWQRRRLAGPALREQLEYWRGQLADLPPTHSLALDAPRSAAAAEGGERYGVRLDMATLQALRELAARHDASLFMLLHTSLAALLAGFGAGTDLAIGTPVAGRGHVDLEPMIGFFVNTLVLRSDLSGDPDFETALARVRRTDLEAYGNAEVPFDMLVEELNPVRSLLHAPLFQILFNMRNNERVHLRMPGLEIAMQEQEAALAKFDLQIGAEESDDGLLLDWLAAPGLFSPARVRRMADAWVSLLTQVAADPGRKLSGYALLDAHERAEVLALGQGADRTEGRELPLPLAIAQAARRHPHAPAVRAGETTLSYAELERLSNRLTHRLAAAGLGPGDRVGLCMERGLALPVALLAVLASGAAYVPLDGHQGGERLARIIADAGIGVVLVESGSAPASLGGVDTIYLDGAGTDPDWLGEYPSQPPTTALADDAIAYVLYTSGSTGEPKGVEVFHSGLSDYCAFAREGYYDEALDGSLVATSHAFDLTVPSLYVPLLEGGCVELLPPGEELPALARRLDEEAGAWLLRLTPSHVQGLLQLADAVPRQGAHAFVIGGEAFPASLARALQTKYPQARLVNHYGPTETVVGCAWQRLDEAQLSGEGTLPIGRAMSNTRLYVLGASGQLLPRGVAGELYIGGAGVARGYLNDASRTAERFLADPFEAGGRMYRSGDRVRWRSDGALEFLGRVDAQVKLRGYRIEPGEIESVLRPQVGDVAVGVYGEGGAARLVAWVSGVSGDGWEDGLRALAASRLPAYMQPSVYVSLEALPLTANGKLDRRRLPEPPAAGAELPWVEPEGEIECTLERIWAQALDLERVSATADFFALGGHSLLAMRVINDVQREFGIELPLRRLFESPDIRSLARLVGDQRIRSDNLAGAGTDSTQIEMEW